MTAFMAYILSFETFCNLLLWNFSPLPLKSWHCSNLTRKKVHAVQRATFIQFKAWLQVYHQHTLNQVLSASSLVLTFLSLSFHSFYLSAQTPPFISSPSLFLTFVSAIAQRNDTGQILRQLLFLSLLCPQNRNNSLRRDIMDPCYVCFVYLGLFYCTTVKESIVRQMKDRCEKMRSFKSKKRLGKH